MSENIREGTEKAKSSGRGRSALVFGLAAALVGVGGWVAHALVATNTPAGASATLPYRGHIDIAGAPLPGPTAKLSFTLYASPTVTAGETPIWGPEVHPTVSVSGGNFSVLLGSVTDLPDAALAGNRWLAIAVNDTPLTGRQLLASAPYARRAAPGQDFAVDGTATMGTASVSGAATMATASVTNDATIGGTATATAGVIAPNVGGCYTAWGTQACAAGYQQVVKGRSGGVESYHTSGAVQRSAPECISDSATALETWSGTYYNRMMRGDADANGMDAIDPLCAVCCRGGTYAALATNTCAEGYAAAYTGRIGGIEQHQGLEVYGSTLCIAGSASAKFTWASGYWTRLMRHRLQPTTGGANGMDRVSSDCALCVSSK